MVHVQKETKNGKHFNGYKQSIYVPLKTCESFQFMNFLLNFLLSNKCELTHIIVEKFLL